VRIISPLSTCMTWSNGKLVVFELGLPSLNRQCVRSDRPHGPWTFWQIIGRTRCRSTKASLNVKIPSQTQEDIYIYNNTVQKWCLHDTHHYLHPKWKCLANYLISDTMPSIALQQDRNSPSPMVSQSSRSSASMNLPLHDSFTDHGLMLAPLFAYLSSV